MSDSYKCEKCGGELRAETAGGLCPRCLMALNFESRTMPEGERPDYASSLSLEEMRQHFPQYEILECLGRGGMGVVYKARQKALDRLVAIKVLAGERQEDVTFAKRFEREAKILAQMHHSNIVTVYDFGESDGLYYLVMEYVDGVNLRDLLADGKIDPKQALAIVPPICEALEYAHDKGVVHRDIKPENLLLDREGRVKIADFGIASLVGASCEKSGTPPYMAPEQERGVVDRRADIYALGAVLYEMLTGERPGKDLVAPSKRIQIDVRLDEIVLRALEKEPERRYQTAAEFRTMVQTIATTPTSSSSSPAAPAASSPVSGLSKRSYWPPVVIVRDGQRVIHWPGVLIAFACWCGLVAVVMASVAMLMAPFWGYPYKIWFLVPVWWLVGASWQAWAVKRDLHLPVRSPWRPFVIVGLRNGKRVINWPAVVIDTLIMSAFWFVGVAIAGQILPLDGSPAWIMILLPLLLLITGTMILSIHLGLRVWPEHRLVALDELPFVRGFLLPLVNMRGAWVLIAVALVVTLLVSYFEFRQSRALAQRPPQSSVRLVTQENKFGFNRLEWKVTPDRPVHVTAGWYALEEGRVVDYRDLSSSVDAVSEPFNLAWEYKTEGDQIAFGMGIGGSIGRGTRVLPSVMDLRTKWQTAAMLRSDQYTELWRGSFFELENNTEEAGRSYVFVARLLRPDENPKVSQFGEDVRKGRLPEGNQAPTLRSEIIRVPGDDRAGGLEENGMAASILDHHHQTGLFGGWEVMVSLLVLGSLICGLASWRTRLGRVVVLGWLVAVLMTTIGFAILFGVTIKRQRADSFAQEQHDKEQWERMRERQQRQIATKAGSGVLLPSDTSPAAIADAITLYGVLPDGGGDIFDAQGNKIGSGPAVGPWEWSPDDQATALIFDFPNDIPIQWETFPRLYLAGTDQGLGGGMPAWTSEYLGRTRRIQSLSIDRTTRTKVSFGMHRMVPVKAVDITLRYLLPARGKAACTFTGPFEAGREIKAQEGFDCTITPIADAGASQSDSQFHIVSVNVPISSDDYDRVFAYDLAGQRYFPRSSGGSISGAGKGTSARRDYRFENLPLARIAAITVGEQPQQKTFRNVALRPFELPPRTHPPYLDAMAARLGKPADRAYRFKGIDEAIALLDVVQGPHRDQAWEIIEKTNFKTLNRNQQEKLRKTARVWADQGYLPGILIGLKGQWPEFAELAIERLKKPSRDRWPLAEWMHLYSQYTPDQLNAIAEVLLEHDDPRGLHRLLFCLRNNRERPGGREALDRIARSDKVWLWWPAMEFLAGSGSLTFLQLDRDLQIKYLAMTDPDRGLDKALAFDARFLLVSLPSAKLAAMSTSTMGNVLRSVVKNLQQAEAEAVLLDLLQDMLEDWNDPELKYEGYSSSMWWPIDRVVRQLNSWHELNLGGIGADLNRETQSGKIDWPAVARETLKHFSRALSPPLTVLPPPPQAAPKTVITIALADALGQPLGHALLDGCLSGVQRYGYLLPEPLSGAARVRVQTDEYGRASIDWPGKLDGESVYGFVGTVTHPDYGTAPVLLNRTGSPQQVCLVPKSSAHYRHALRGQVVDEAGRPISDARVESSEVKDGVGGKRYNGKGQAVADSTGRFVMPFILHSGGDTRRLLPADAVYSVVARSPRGMDLFPAYAENASPMKLVLKTPTLAPRRLRFEVGANKYVGSNAWVNISLAWQANEDSRYSISLESRYTSGNPVRLLPGKYMAGFNDGRARRFQYLPVVINESSPDVITFERPPAITYQGRVVDGTTGEPVSGAYMFLSGSGSQRNFAMLADDDWQVLDSMSAVPSLDDYGVKILNQHYVIENIVRTDAEGHYSIVRGREDQASVLVGFARNQLPYTQRLDKLKADVNQQVQMPDIPLFPAACLQFVPKVPIGEKPTVYAKWNLSTADGQPTWLGAFKKAKEHVESNDWLDLSAPVRVFVPAEVSFKLSFKGSRTSDAQPVPPDEILKLNQGEIRDLGDLKFMPPLENNSSHAPEAEDGASTFGPEIERTLRFRRPGADLQDDVLWLKDGAISSLPAGFFNHMAASNRRWLNQRGPGLFPGFVVRNEEPLNPAWGLGTAGTKFVLVPKSWWDAPPVPTELAEAVRNGHQLPEYETQGAEIACLPEIKEVPVTLAFLSDTGWCGLMQVLHTSQRLKDEDSMTITLRYRTANYPGIAVLGSPAEGNASPQAPRLQFRLEATEFDEAPWLPMHDEPGTHKADRLLHVREKVLLDETNISSARASTDPQGFPQVEVNFTEEGKERFAEITANNIGRRLVIVFDGRILSAPVIRNEISGGSAVISGVTEADAAELVKVLNENTDLPPEKLERIVPPPISGTPDPRNDERVEAALGWLQLLPGKELTELLATKPVGVSDWSGWTTSVNGMQFRIRTMAKSPDGEDKLPVEIEIRNTGDKAKYIVDPAKMDDAYATVVWQPHAIRDGRLYQMNNSFPLAPVASTEWFVLLGPGQTISGTRWISMWLPEGIHFMVLRAPEGWLDHGAEASLWKHTDIDRISPNAWRGRKEPTFIGPIRVQEPRDKYTKGYKWRPAVIRWFSTSTRMDEYMNRGANNLTEEHAVKWGDAHQGVQVRLQADKRTWETGQTPTFRADIRNQGKGTYTVAQAQQLCELELDGARYKWVGSYRVRSSYFPPGREYKDIPVALTENWGKVTSTPPQLDAPALAENLKLAPGKHTLRLIFFCDGGSSHRSIVIESNAVEFEVASEGTRVSELTFNALLAVGLARPVRIATKWSAMGSSDFSGEPPFLVMEGDRAVFTGLVLAVDLRNNSVTLVADGEWLDKPGTDIPAGQSITIPRSEIVRIDQVLPTAQPRSSNRLAFLKRIPEFRKLRMDMSEREFLDHVSQYGLAAEKEEHKGIRSYHLFARSGENVIVMYDDKSCHGIQRMQPDKEGAAKRLAERDRKRKLGYEIYQEASEIFAAGGNDTRAVALFKEVAHLAPFNEEFGRRAADLSQQLETMAKEPVPDEETDTIEGKLDKLIWNLRHAQGGALEVPGEARILVAGAEPNARALGAEIIKLAEAPESRVTTIERMIKMLGDSRPTRIWAGALNGGHFLRNGDVALEILSKKSGKDFDDRSRRDSYLWTASPELRQEIIERVKTWWASENASAEGTDDSASSIHLIISTTHDERVSPDSVSCILDNELVAMGDLKKLLTERLKSEPSLDAVLDVPADLPDSITLATLQILKEAGVSKIALATHSAREDGDVTFLKSIVPILAKITGPRWELKDKPSERGAILYFEFTPRQGSITHRLVIYPTTWTREAKVRWDSALASIRYQAVATGSNCTFMVSGGENQRVTDAIVAALKLTRLSKEQALNPDSTDKVRRDSSKDSQLQTP
jgi:predicted Ser/Thr protein kinase